MSSRAIFGLPGLFTVTPPAGRERFFWDLGFRWIIRQAQNDVQIQPYDLSSWRDVGFKTGVWGVTYDAANFARDGHALAAQANKAGPNGGPCDLLLIDAEECLKNADPAPLINALADYAGPKGLSTLGAASGLNVFPIHYAAFLAAGYDVFPQAYYGWALEYEPKHCLEHAARAGIPRDRLHLTIDSSGENQPPPVGLGHGVSASEWVALWSQAGIGTSDASVFMAEFDYDYAGLRPILALPAPAQPAPLPPPPAPAPTPTPNATRTAMLKLGNAQEAVWRNAGYSDDRIRNQRIGLADQILRLGDSSFAARRADIRKALGL